MLPLPKSRRKPAARCPFRNPLWDDLQPDCQRIDALLPHDHHARWLRCVVARLDLTAFRLSYAGYGSLAFPVELLLAFVLFLYSKGVLSPAEWARKALYDDQCKWLLRGLKPSRSQLYTFRDRVEPFLDDWHRQLIAWAIVEGLTTARRGSLDGTFVAALASRHQLMSRRRVDRRLLLLESLVWFDDGQTNLATRLEQLPELLLLAGVLWLWLLNQGLEAAELFQTLLGLLVLLERLSPQGEAVWPPRLPAWLPGSVSGRQRVLKRYEQAQQRLEQRLRPLEQKQKLSKKDRDTIKYLRVSLTDPEAALGWDKVGTYRPLYNVVLVQATDAPLTLAWDVLSRNNDDGLLKPMMEKTQEQLGRYVEEVLGDGAFMSVADVAWCEQQQITVYGPSAKAKATQAEAGQAKVDKEEKKKKEEGTVPQSGQTTDSASPAAKFPKEAFRYDSVDQVYICPEGKRLEAATQTTDKRSNGQSLPLIVHRASGEDCQACPQQQRCTSNPKRGRTVKRYEGEEALERLRQRMTEPVSQQVYKQRSRSVELGYADLKEHRGLRVFAGFGRKRARAQAGLVILGSNGLVIMRMLLRRQSSDPPPQEKQVA